MGADIPKAFQHRGEIDQLAGAQWKAARGVRFGEFHAADEPRRGHEGTGVEQEYGIAAEPRRHEAAQRRAGRQAEGPRNRGKGIGGEHLIFRNDIRDRRAMRRLEKRHTQGFHKQQRVDQPHHTRRANRQHAEDDEEARHIGGDHDGFAADAIVDHAGGGSGECAGQHLQNYGKPHGLRLTAGQLQQQIVDGQRVKPVAQLADHLREPEQAVVAVIAQQVIVGGEHTGLCVQGYVYRPMRSFTSRTVLSAMGATRSAPSRSMRAR